VTGIDPIFSTQRFFFRRNFFGEKKSHFFGPGQPSTAEAAEGCRDPQQNNNQYNGNLPNNTQQNDISTMMQSIKLEKSTGHQNQTFCKVTLY
jgi:hypothetical protein